MGCACWFSLIIFEVISWRQFILDEVACSFVWQQKGQVRAPTMAKQKDQTNDNAHIINHMSGNAKLRTLKIIEDSRLEDCGR